MSRGGSLPLAMREALREFGWARSALRTAEEHVRPMNGCGTLHIDPRCASADRSPPLLGVGVHQGKAISAMALCIGKPMGSASRWVIDPLCASADRNAERALANLSHSRSAFRMAEGNPPLLGGALGMDGLSMFVDETSTPLTCRCMWTGQVGAGRLVGTTSIGVPAMSLARAPKTTREGACAPLSRGRDVLAP